MGVEDGIPDQPEALGHFDAPLAVELEPVVLEDHGLREHSRSCRSPGRHASTVPVSLQEGRVQGCPPDQGRESELVTARGWDNDDPGTRAPGQFHHHPKDVRVDRPDRDPGG
jgi:hypothetical protein